MTSCDSESLLTSASWYPMWKSLERGEWMLCWGIHVPSRNAYIEKMVRVQLLEWTPPCPSGASPMCGVYVPHLDARGISSVANLSRSVSQELRRVARN